MWSACPSALPSEHGHKHKVHLEGGWDEPEPDRLTVIWNPLHLMDRRADHSDPNGTMAVMMDTRVADVTIALYGYFEWEEEEPAGEEGEGPGMVLKVISQV